MLCDLRLLFPIGVDEDCGQLIVLDAFDLPLFVPKREQRLGLLHFLRAQTDVTCAAVLPGKDYRAQSVNDIQDDCF